MDINLLAVGDFMSAGELSQNISRYIDNCWSPNISTMLKAADIRFCNLECSYYSASEPPDRDKTLLYAKEEACELISKADFNIVSLANNHIMDFGWDSVEKTIQLLSNKGIKCVGAGIDLDAARAPSIINVKGRTIAFLAYSAFYPVKNSRYSEATKNKSGVAPYRLDYILEDVKLIRNSVDYIIVSIHWGEEYIRYPIPEQIDDARIIIDAGSDVILGHHSHVSQGFQIYKNKPIFFSLGNFLFSPYYATNIGRHINYEEEGEVKKSRRTARIGSTAIITLNHQIDFKITPVKQNKVVPTLSDLNKTAQFIYNTQLSFLTFIYKWPNYNRIYKFIEALFNFKERTFKPVILIEAYGFKEIFIKILRRYVNKH